MEVKNNPKSEIRNPKWADRYRGLPHGVRQFIKFCIVGFANTSIDWIIAFILIKQAVWPLHAAASLKAAFHLPFETKDIRNILANTISSGTATCNSFIWNRRWTFRVKGKERRGRQFLQFALVNITGMILNATITTLILKPFPANPPIIALGSAKAVATSIVVFWNFFMNKHWTFRDAQNSEVKR